MNKKKLVIGIIGVATVLVVLGTTVAYFLISVDNNNKEILEVNTGSLSLIFDDNNDGMQVKSLMLGESVSKEVKITNNGTLPATTNLNWKDLTNTYLAKSLSYKVQYKTSEAGAWTDIPAEHTHVPTSETGTKVTILKDITIPKDGTYFYKITITFDNTDENQESDRNAMLATRFNLGDYYKALSASEKAIAHLNIEVNETTDTVPNFALAAKTDEGVFAMEDDYGTSYYYRGAVTNNYVKFGGFYWRIIIINGDGSLRMIYDGTSYHVNGEDSADRYTKTGQVFNAKSNDPKYVGYMYGGSSKDAASTSAKEAQTNIYDSDIKTVVDEWYENNILKNMANSNTNISKYLADIIFCNDREIETDIENSNGGYLSNHNYTDLGFSNNPTSYKSASRIGYQVSHPSPHFWCTNKNDSFTVNDTVLGNGSLIYPIGLITADEIVAAGDVYKFDNKNYYLFKGNVYWTMSPRDFAYNNQTYVFFAYSDYYSYTYNKAGVAPVINLKAEYVTQLVGTGVKDDEYRLPDIQ